MGDSGWKKNLWDYLAMAIGFWILKPEKSKAEKVGVSVVAILTIVVMVFT